MNNWIFEDSKVYDILKFLASPMLPAVATMCVAIGQIWNLPVLSLVGATVAAVAACLGEITHVSSKKYWAAQETGGNYIEEDEDNGDISEGNDK